MPDDEPDEPDDEPFSGAISGLVGPDLACVEEGDRLQMYAEVVGLPENAVRWSVLSGPARISRSGDLRPTGGGEAVVRAASVDYPAFFDTTTVTVGGCTCQVSAIPSGDTTKTNAPEGAWRTSPPRAAPP
ncbi:MAG: hypothetical protein R2991_08640 [Thermoanaerobaculia bacterium]